MSTFKFRAWPTEYKTITQHFGARPWFYQQFGFPGHEGIDFRAPAGSKIFCVAPGTVSEVFPQNGIHNYGNHVTVQHEDGYVTIYAHLSEISVQPGQRVRSGQILGLAGESGLAQGAHLHLTLKHAGEVAPGYRSNIIDPTPFVLPLLEANWNDATFLHDIVPDGTVMPAGAEFVQSWTLRNSGQSTWDEGYQLVLLSDEGLAAPSAVVVPPAPPGATVPISVTLRTPATAGRYRCFYQLRDSEGNYFGDRVWTIVETVVPAGVPRAEHVASAAFVQRVGNQLQVHGRPLRFFGVNLRGLIHYGRIHEDPLKHSRLEHRASQLQAAYALGARVVRIFLADKNASTAEIIERFKEVLQLVKNNYPDLYLLPVFTNLYNDVPFYVAGDGTFYQNMGGRDLLNHDFFKEGYRKHYLPFVQAVVAEFAHEPNILAWGIGNELKLEKRSEADPWTFVDFNRAVAAEIKRLDQNHLVTTGMKSTHHAWLHSNDLQDALYGSPNIDFVTIHSYEGMHDQDGDRRVWDDVSVAHRHAKPFIVEEAGFDIRVFGDRTPKYADHLNRWFAAGAMGYMPWGFIHQNEIGDGDKWVGIGSNVPDFDRLCELFRNFARPLIAGHRSLTALETPAAAPRSVGIAGFDFPGYNRQFIANPGGDPLNNASGYGVHINPVDVATGEHYWRVIGIHHLTPDENKGRHHIYVDVLDETGQRVSDPNLAIGFNWQENTEPPPQPKRLDKPSNEPATNVPMDKNPTYSIWVVGGPSDVVAGLHTRHPDEADSQGAAQNAYGHHSYYVVFQRTRQVALPTGGDTQTNVLTNDAVKPPTTPNERPPISATPTRAKDKLGVDANRPIDPKTGRIAPQVTDPTIIADTGVGWVRLNFVMGECWQGPNDSSRPQGLTWAESYRQIINGFRTQGLRIYGLISDEAVHESHEGQLRRAPSSADEHQAWIDKYVQNFVEIVRLFHIQMEIFESFNEPDDWKRDEVPGWSDSTPNLVHPDWFAIILQRIYQAVKRDPAIAHVKLISGPLQGLDNNGNAGARYLDRVYEAGKRFFNWGQPGSPVPFHGVGYHLYIAEGERSNVRQAWQLKYNRYMDEVRAVIRQHEGRDKPIYLSEIGWANDGSLDHLQREAMEAVVDTILTDQSVALGIWFCTQDFPGKPYGLYRMGDLSFANRKSNHAVLQLLCERPLQPVAIADVTTSTLVDVNWFGVVTASLLNLRQGPGVEHVQIGTLPAGTQVEVIGHIADWLRVKVNGQEGFVHAGWVRPIPLAMERPIALPRGLATAPAPALPKSNGSSPSSHTQELTQTQSPFHQALAEAMDPEWMRQALTEHILLLHQLLGTHNGYTAHIAATSEPEVAQTITAETVEQIQALAGSQRS